MKLVSPQIAPPLDPGFRPAALANRAFRRDIAAASAGTPLAIALERADGSVSRYDTVVFEPGHPRADENYEYVERLVKFLLWQRGGWRVVIGGPPDIAEHLTATYSPTGPRAFDREIMGERIYDRPFEIVSCPYEAAPKAAESSNPLGRHLDGCRVGFDLGASDRKSSAVVEGEAIFSTEIPWDPRPWSDPELHYQGIHEIIAQAAEQLPRVDAIGGSAAGVYVNNRVRIASLFRGVSDEDFAAHVVGIFERLKEDWGGVPFEVVNDGEVTALAGSMSLGVNAILGIAMGSSQAGGYVTPEGYITGWLNELAFVPIDYSPDAPADEWSGDIGCGVQYFSQQAVCRLAAPADIPLDENTHQAERLKVVQDLMARGDVRARRIYETIGVYLGYALAHYADFYALEHVLILGRVTSGEGGQVILDQARRVLDAEFPELSESLGVQLPDEHARRVGQSIAAASLPAIR